MNKLPDFCRSGSYKVSLPDAFKASCERCLQAVSNETGRSTSQLRKSISLFLKSYLNEGKVPPNTTSGAEHKIYGHIFFCTAAGIQIAFCISDQKEPPEIVIVGMSEG